MIMNVKALLCRMFVLVLRIIYLPIKLIPVKNKIVMISRESNEPSIDFLCIKKEIELKNSDIEVVLLCKKLEKSVFSIVLYCFHIINQMYQLSTSKLAVLDTYCITASVLHHKQSLTIVQIWHSSAAIKKFGYQTLDKYAGTNSKIANALCMHKNYDYFTAPSRITAEFFSEGFNTDITKSKIICLPRLKNIKEGNRDVADSIFNEYPELVKKRNILYAPTFRKGKQIKMDELIKKINKEQYNLIIKLHPLDKKKINTLKYPNVIFDDKFDTCNWFDVVDKVISDYSAIGLEAMVADKEVYFYLYDLDEYQKTTGLNIDFYQEDIKEYVFKSVDGIDEVLNKRYDHEKMLNFRNKYISADVDNCKSAMTDFFVDIVKGEYDG